MRILDKFVKSSGGSYLGAVEMEDFTVEKPVKIVVTLQEVYAIERHHLARGQGMTLVGTVEEKGKWLSKVATLLCVLQVVPST